jgi:SAM-dependent MidA family methyltransferase
MQLALYHPEHGYYRKPGRIGPQGDFLTSPHVHPMFGWAVAGWLRECWERLDRPSPFTVFEPGAGEGRLAGAILDWAEGRSDGFAAALRYVAVDPVTPATADSRITWAAPPLEPVAHGAVVCNELFDAFPVRLFDVTERGPAEVMVRWDGEAFVEARGPIANLDDAPSKGRFEVNPQAYAAMRSLCSLVDRGAVLVFDYGYPQDELWAPWRTTGTLLCFYRHTAHENPYIHVGEQDMTAHVNLSELESAAEDEGFAVQGPVTQASFLHALGLGAAVDAARSDMGEYFTRRRALESLTDTGGLGRVRVLAARRGLDEPLPGFEP